MSGLPVSFSQRSRCRTVPILALAFARVHPHCIKILRVSACASDPQETREEDDVWAQGQERLQRGEEPVYHLVALCTLYAYAVSSCSLRAICGRLGFVAVLYTLLSDERLDILLMKICMLRIKYDR